MSLSDRRTLLALPLAGLVALLASCGFTPVYAPGGTGNALYGQVRVAEPDDRATYLLVEDLEQRLGRSTSPKYELQLLLITAIQGQAVTSSGDITRYSLVGQADYILTPFGSKEVIASGSVENFTGYSATGSTVETLAAERDSRRRLMSILADQIVTRLYSTVELPE